MDRRGTLENVCERWISSTLAYLYSAVVQYKPFTKRLYSLPFVASRDHGDRRSAPPSHSDGKCDVYNLDTLLFPLRKTKKLD
jgi:hypothetical protein